jgi:hypothetical protein
MNRNAINVGVGMLQADADSCILPHDRTRQKHLSDAARALAATPDLIVALRAIDKAARFGATPADFGRIAELARGAIAKATA